MHTRSLTSSILSGRAFTSSNPPLPPPSYHTQEVINTAEITHEELKAAREAAGLYQHQVARLLNESEDTVSRWERGRAMPSDEQVWEMEKLYKAPGLWYGWMRWAHKSFREHFPAIPQTDSLVLSLVNVKYQIGDLEPLHDAMVRDALDGRIDNKARQAHFLREMKEVHAALGITIAIMEGGTA